MQTLRRVRVIMISMLCTLALTCKKEPPPAVHIPTLTLTAVDASCTEAWLKLTTTQVPATVRLMRLTPTLQTLQTLQLTTPDTLLIDEGLLPRRTYTYKAYTLEVRGSGVEVVDSSTQATVTTMDTTSHNFTWQIDTLGDGGGSVLYDVAIINDTIAYAVGEINVRDSLGNWRNPPYNFAKWNGRTWELSTSSDAGYGYGPLYCIFAFGPNDIWAGSSIPEHWDGQRWTFHGSTRGYQGGFWIRKIFGTSSNDLYVVGDAGNIRHYDGVRWRRIESGTRTHINDAWGVVNRVTGEEEVYCAVSSFFTPGDRRILRVKNETVDTIRWDIGKLLYSVWTNKSSFVYAAGSAVFQNKMGRWREEHTGSSIFINNIRGFGLNHIVVVGDFGYISHYNGLTWQIVGVDVNAGYSSVAVESNLVVAVGNRNGRAFIAIGRR